nr:calcium/sodium antiporter [uncultured Desulfuromonas sp.]
MVLEFTIVIIGLVLLVWGADRFVEGAAFTASHFGVPPLLIGMVVIGFGTSLPEMVVSAIAAQHNNPGIALGNAYGSNITNIALILGITAIINPIVVHSRILRRELPMLAGATILGAWQLWDGHLVRFESVLLLGVFCGLMTWTVWQGYHTKEDPFEGEVTQELNLHKLSLGKAVLWLLVGLGLLLVSSRALVWGAVQIAQGFGVSDRLIGLTIVAVGTSLPELASSIIASCKAEHDLALGNILGSNLFNTLAVVGMAGTISPLTVNAVEIHHDLFVMGFLTLSIFFLGYGFQKEGRINRIEGALLLTCYITYTIDLFRKTN